MIELSRTGGQPSAVGDPAVVFRHHYGSTSRTVINRSADLRSVAADLYPQRRRSTDGCRRADWDVLATRCQRLPGRSRRIITCQPRTFPSRRRPVCVRDRKSTRLNSSHDQISYAVFCLKKKKKNKK